MNNRKLIKNFQILSAIFIGIIGTFLHFTYDLSNQNLLVGIFSAINESTWEHLKLIFFPMLITIIVGYFYIGKNIPNFLCAKTIGLLTSISLTIIFFYTYTGVLGYNVDILNILTFFTAVFLGEFIAYKIMISNVAFTSRFSSIILIILFFLFAFFTYNPPKIGLFKDPITSEFGI